MCSRNESIIKLKKFRSELSNCEKAYEDAMIMLESRRLLKAKVSIDTIIVFCRRLVLTGLASGAVYLAISNIESLNYMLSVFDNALYAFLGGVAALSVLDSIGLIKRAREVDFNIRKQFSEYMDMYSETYEKSSKVLAFEYSHPQIIDFVINILEDGIVEDIDDAIKYLEDRGMITNNK